MNKRAYGSTWKWERRERRKTSEFLRIPKDGKSVFVLEDIIAKKAVLAKDRKAWKRYLKQKKLLADIG